jgi:hypothetical protein
MYSNTDFDTNINTTVGDPLDPGNFIPGLNLLSMQEENLLRNRLKI